MYVENFEKIKQMQQGVKNKDGYSARGRKNDIDLLFMEGYNGV